MKNNIKTKNLPTIQLAEFNQIAEYAGQDIDSLALGDDQKTYWRIHTMEQAREVLSRANQLDRKMRSQTFLKGLEYRSRIAQGMHDRGEAYVFANHPLEAERDRGGHNNHMPIYVRTWSIMNKTLMPGEVWDVTLYPSEWGVDDKEEMYNILNIGCLTMGKNSRIIVRGNAFIFTCQQLMKMGMESYPYDIGILATQHGFGNRIGDFNGQDGMNGKNGKNGQHGLSPVIGNTFLGPVLTGDYDRNKAQGQEGEHGEAGTNGENGLNGGACRITEINIRYIEATYPVVIGIVPGQGGNGGDGGQGGNGGKGGDGTSAIKTMDGWIPASKGGRGGQGGRGGRGGRAGNGGISSNVLINVPEKFKNDVRFYSRGGQPGQSGKGGKSGMPGKNGKDGANTIPDSPTQNGKRDFDEKVMMITPERFHGKDGREGRVMPPAKIYLNNVWVNNSTFTINNL